jgi:hypothetical protein
MALAADATTEAQQTLHPISHNLSWSASLSPFARWESGELRGLADAPQAAGERPRLG